MAVKKWRKRSGFGLYSYLLKTESLDNAILELSLA